MAKAQQIYDSNPEFGRDRLSVVTANVYAFIDKGGRKKQVAKYLKKNGYTMDSWSQAVINRASKQAAQPFFAGEITKDYIREVVDSATFGLSKMAEAFMTSVVNGTDYQDEFNTLTLDQTRFQENMPITAGIGRFGGGGVAGTGTTKLAMKAFPKLGPVPGQPVRNTVKDIKIGAPLAGAEAAGYEFTSQPPGGIDPVTGNRVEPNYPAAVGLGVGLGTVAPVAINPVAAGVSKVLPKKDIPGIGEGPPPSDPPGGLPPGVVPPGGAPPGPHQRALEDISGELESDMLPTDVIRQRAADAENIGLGDQVMLPDIAGQNVIGGASGSNLQYGSRSRDLGHQNLLDRQRNIRDMVINFASEGLGTRVNIPKYMKTRKTELFNEAQPFYQEFNKMGPFEHPRLDELFQSKPFQDAYKEAKDMALLEKPPVFLPDELPIGSYPPLVIDAVKKGLDEMLRKPSMLTGVGPGKAKLLRERKNEMLEIIDNQLAVRDEAGQIIEEGPYAKARAIYSDGKTVDEALTKGREAFKRGMDADDIEVEFSELTSEAERDMFRVGAITGLGIDFGKNTAQGANYAAKLQSPEAQRKVNILFRAPEEAELFLARLKLLSEMSETKTSLLGNSESIRRLSNMQGKQMPSAGQLLEMGRNPGTTGISNIATMIQNRLLSDQARRTADAAAPLYFNPGTTGIYKTMDEIDQLRDELLKRQQQRAGKSQGVTAGLMNMVGPGFLNE